jgi:hypothetical protein
MCVSLPALWSTPDRFATGILPGSEPNLLLTETRLLTRESENFGCLTSYGDVTNYIQWTCAGHKGEPKALIRCIAAATGLPHRVGNNEAVAFFAPPEQAAAHLGYLRRGLSPSVLRELSLSRFMVST